MNTLHALTLLGLIVATTNGCSSSNAAEGSGMGGSGAAGRSGSGGGAGSGSSNGGASGGAGFNPSGGGGATGAAGGSAGSNGGSAARAGSNGGNAGSAGAVQAPAGWTLAWSDEFDCAKGDSLDNSKWHYDVGPNNANKELEYYTDRPENSGCDGAGHFLITALHEDYMGHQYTSAKFTSSGTYEPTYGRLEARIKLPAGKGLWPAFWALGTDIGDPGVGWPACGEMDIMETVGDQLTTNHGSLHGPGYSGGSPLTGTYDLPGGLQFDQDFHVFAAEWEENVVRFYVDDHLYETKTPSDVPGGARWVYDHSVFMILNVAVGGTWPGTPDDSIFPRSMVIDYVRVYERPTR